jgi:hypothetical protein
MTKMRHLPGTAFATTLALLAAISMQLAGCAETNATTAIGASTVKVREATTCPQCRMVAVTVPSPIFPSSYGGPFTGFGAGYGWRGLTSGFVWGTGRGDYATVYEDKCPGCSGVLKTFFTEGKWKHKCSVCAQRPFTCPVVHPD